MLAGARAPTPGRRARCARSATGGRRSRAAVAAARPGDAVVVAGKGHETGPGDRRRACTRSTTGRAAAALAALAATRPTGMIDPDADPTMPATDALASRRGRRAAAPAPAGDRAWSPVGRVRLPRGRARARCSWRCPASGSTGTTSPPPPSRPGAVARARPRARSTARGDRPPAAPAHGHDLGDRPGRRWRRARRAGRAGRHAGRRAAGLDRRRRHRLVRQDLDQGPARRGAARRCGADGAPRRSRSTTSSATRTRCCAPTRRPATWCWSCPPAGSGHIAALAAIAPPRIGVVLNVGTRAPRRVRLRGGDRRRPRASWSRRCRRRRRRGRGAQRRRPAGRGDGGADRRPGGHRRHRRRRRRPRRRRRARRRRPGAGSRLVTPDGRGAGGAAAWSAPTRSATRWPPPRSALELGLTPAERRRGAVGGRARVAGGGWRSPSRADGVTVVNDAYNANPESMRAALRALATIGRAAGATWAVLGAMAELGAGRRGRARRGRPAGRPSWASTGSSSVGEPPGAASGAHRDGSWAASRTRADVAAALAAARRAGARATWCWSRRPGRPAWSGSPLALLDAAPPTRGRRRAGEGDPDRRGRRARGVDPAHPVPDPVLRPAGLRPGDPRRTARRPTRPSAARRPWAASRS